jgi:hypothetical protein
MAIDTLSALLAALFAYSLRLGHTAALYLVAGCLLPAWPFEPYL